MGHETRNRQEAHMIRADRVHLLDFIAESHGVVYDELKEVMWGGFASKKLELAIYCPRP